VRSKATRVKMLAGQVYWVAAGTARGRSWGAAPIVRLPLLRVTSNFCPPMVIVIGHLHCALVIANGPRHTTEVRR
jgi:hypothetical protein